MVKQYSAVNGQSVYDICAEVYGTLNLLYKLLIDSSIPNVNYIPKTGDIFLYDDTLIITQNVSNQVFVTKQKFATNKGDLGNVYYIIEQASPPRLITGVPILPPPENTNDMYQKVMETSFTSGADGTTEIYPLDENGNSMAGSIYTIVQCELEIKPLKKAQYVWNTVQGKITLIDTGLDNGQTLFILYAQMIQP